MGPGVREKDNVREGPEGVDEDGAVSEDESGAKEEGGESKGGDPNSNRPKRKRAQGTLDRHFKKAKT